MVYLFLIFNSILYKAKEINFIWHEWDLHSYYRSKLILFTAVYSLRGIRFPIEAWLYFGVVLCSNFSMDGMPNMNESSLTLMSYIVLLYVPKEIHLVQKYLEVSLYLVSFFAGVQWFYPNFVMLPIFHWFVGGDFQTPPGVICSTFANPNHLGLYAALLFPFFFYLRKYLPAAIAFLLGVASKSRGGVLGMLSGIHPLLPLPLVVYHGFHMDEARLFMWRNTLKLLPYLIGRGPLNFILEFPQNTQDGIKFLGQGIYVDRPHNLYLSLWYELGPFGLLLFSYIVFAHLKGSRPEVRAAATGFLVAAFFTDSVVSVTPIFFIILGCRKPQSKRH